MVAFKRPKMSTKKSPYRANQVQTCSFIIGADLGTTVNVAVQLKDERLENAAVKTNLYIYLSDDAVGDVLVVTAPSGGWAIGTDGTIHAITAGKTARILTEANGKFDVTITEAGAKTLYLNVVMPDGSVVISPVITFV